MKTKLLLLSACLAFLAGCRTTPTPPGPMVYPEPVQAPTAYPLPAQPVDLPYPAPPNAGQAGACLPTPADSLGPFYKPGAPLRDTVGQGYQLSGVVRSSPDCAPIAGAQIELWMAGPDGQYADQYRATIYSDYQGRYTFTSHPAVAYENRPPHIHIKVTIPGFQELVTQHYPPDGAAAGVMDLVLAR